LWFGFSDHGKRKSYWHLIKVVTFKGNIRKEKQGKGVHWIMRELYDNEKSYMERKGNMKS
jgi:hypothetical protein